MNEDFADDADSGQQLALNRWNLRNLCCFLFVACLVVAVAPAAGAAEPARSPNVVLIISDDHAWTDYGFMGHATVRTPRLDGLAAQSLLFRRGYVPSSLCCPSLASIVTGLYPHQHRITCNDPPMPAGMRPAEFNKSKAFLDGREAMNRHLDAVPTIPRVLSAAGYATLQTGKWWQGDFARGGFTHGMTKGARHGDQGLDIGRRTMQPIYDFVRQARKDGKPFFVWYAPMLPHDPHNPPERLLARYKDKAPPNVARYLACVEWFDETCGQLLDFLDREGLAQDTIVMYVADNGYVPHPERAGAMRSKLTPYDAGLRTPIMVRWPAKVKPADSPHLASSLDLAPTLYAALGLKVDAKLPGLNLLDEQALAARQALHGACFTHNAADLDDPAKNVVWRWSVEGKWKLILPVPGRKVDRGDGGPDKPALYDVLGDPHERTDLAARHPEVVEAMIRSLDAWWKP